MLPFWGCHIQMQGEGEGGGQYTVGPTRTGGRWPEDADGAANRVVGETYRGGEEVKRRRLEGTMSVVVARLCEWGEGMYKQLWHVSSTYLLINKVGGDTSVKGGDVCVSESGFLWGTSNQQSDWRQFAGVAGGCSSLARKVGW